jgi:hypothetical protein
MEDDMVNAKARAEAFWDEVFNRHDLTRIEEFIAPGSVNHNARAWTADGPQGAREVFGRLWAGSSDMHFQLGRWSQKETKSSASGSCTAPTTDPSKESPPPAAIPGLERR